MPATSYNDLVLEGEALIEGLTAKHESTDDTRMRADIRATISTLQQTMDFVNSSKRLNTQDIAAHALKTLIDVLSKSPAFD